MVSCQIWRNATGAVILELHKRDTKLGEQEICTIPRNNPRYSRCC